MTPVRILGDPTTAWRALEQLIAPVARTIGTHRTPHGCIRHGTTTLNTLAEVDQ